MTRILKISLSLVLITSLPACYNAVNFHQSERLSIALESKSTDPTQPIQGTLGSRNRTVLVAPGKDGNFAADSMSLSPGESTSVISDLEVAREKGGLWNFGTTTVHSTFITGKAAKNAPEDTIVNVAGLDVAITGDLAIVREQVLRNIMSALVNLSRSNPSDDIATTYINQLNALASVLPTGTDYANIPSYVQETRGESVSIRKISTKAPVDSSFNGVIDYLGDLSRSLSIIEKTERDRSIQDDNAGAPIQISPQALEQILLDKKKLETIRNKLFKETLSSPVIDAAASYVLNYL